MIETKILRNQDPEALCKAMNPLLNEGWTMMGTLQIVQAYTDSNGYINWPEYVQMLYRVKILDSERTVEREL